MLPKILIVLCLTASAQPLIAQQSDPRYHEQWHLTGETLRRATPMRPATTITTIDINVEPVWNTYRGSTNTYIAIVDSNVQLDHEDLRDNVSTVHNHFYYSSSTDAFHGTAVAGIVAARGFNGIGIRGVAPSAKIYSLNLLADIRSDGTSSIIVGDIVDAMGRNARVTSVSNNSWGETRPFAPKGDFLTIWRRAIEEGITTGFHGKGTVYTFAAGNNHCKIMGLSRICTAENANYDGYVNYHATVAVCAVDYRGRHNGGSEHGANLWVCAPSRDSRGRYGILTTGDSNKYTTFGGTSAATPMVSGVVALMRQANPSLSWRDVRMILAASAQHNHADDDGWQRGAIQYASFGKRYRFNHKYGFGVVDAQRAVALAENWINLPARTMDTLTPLNQTSIGSDTSTSISVNIDVQSDINFIEYVDIPIRYMTLRYSDLEIKLISPAGTTSILATPADRGFSSLQTNFRWQFGSARHLGEDASGIWRLELRAIRSNSIQLEEWRLRIRGYQIKMDATPVQGLTDLGIKIDPENSPLILSLSGAVWKPNLQLHDFKLKNAPQGLRINEVRRTSDTQVQLILQIDANLPNDSVFQVEATTRTVSNHAKTLLSNDIKITSVLPDPRIIVHQGIVIPDGIAGKNYDFTLDDIFASSETLSYLIRGNVPPGLQIDGSRISGTPTTVGDYHWEVTASHPNGDSQMRSFVFKILPYNITVNIRIFLEGALMEIPLVNICDRTRQVQNKIISLTGNADCTKVVKRELEAITELDLGRESIRFLVAGDFDGLNNLQTLNLSKNNLNTLVAGDFDGLANLQTLHLGYNNLNTLAAGIFSGLDNLQSLNLSNNNLNTLATGVFDGLDNLQTLNASDNNISTLTSVVFNGLTNLQNLNLANHELDTLPRGIFDRLSDLQYLDLRTGRDTALTQLPAGIFDQLISLQQLYLNSNELGDTYCNNLKRELPKTLANISIIQCD